MLALKVALFLILLISAPTPQLEEFVLYGANWNYRDKSAIDLKLSCSDVGHYLDVAANGYSGRRANDAFYPLWPALLKVFGIPTSAHPGIFSAGLATLLWSMAIYLLWRFLEMAGSSQCWNAVLIMLLVLPSAFFYWVGYSESLFLFLFVSALTFAEGRMWGISGGCLLLLPCTRAVGFLACSAVLARTLLQCQPKRTAILLLCAVSGEALYLLIMRRLTGDPFSGFKAQAFYPNSPSIVHLVQPVQLATQWASIDGFHTTTGSFLDRFMFAISLTLLPRIYAVRPSWAVSAGLMVIVPAFSSFWMSYSRFVIVIVPCIIIAGTYLRSIPLICRLVIIGGLFSCQLDLIQRFFQFQWAN